MAVEAELSGEASHTWLSVPLVAGVVEKRLTAVGQSDRAKLSGDGRAGASISQCTVDMIGYEVSCDLSIHASRRRWGAPPVESAPSSASLPAHGSVRCR